MIKIMAEANSASDHSLLWGYALEFWDRAGIVSLIVGAILGVLALLLTAASAYILYRVADAAQVELVAQTKTSAELIAGLNLETARLAAAGEASRQKIAEANARALEAKLELEKFRAPRALTSEQQAILANELRGKVPEINVVSKADVESREYSRQFTTLLRNAGIKVTTGSLSPLDSAVLANNNLVVVWSKDWMGKDGFPDPDDPLYRAVSKAGLWGGSGGQASFIPDGSKDAVIPDIPTIYIFQKTPW